MMTLEKFQKSRHFIEKKPVGFLQNEQFACIIESKDGEIIDKILRIDLFRKLDVTDKREKEFTGGIVHCVKHFSIDNINLSTGNDIHNIQ